MPLGCPIGSAAWVQLIVRCRRVAIKLAVRRRPILQGELPYDRDVFQSDLQPRTRQGCFMFWVYGRTIPKNRLSPDCKLGPSLL